MDVDVHLVVKGLKDELEGKKLLISDDELRRTMTAYQQELRQKQMQTRMMAAMDNKKEGDTFLAENKKKEGVVTLPSGLQYKILKEGQGPKPKADDVVEVKYRGTFINGKEFDSSGSETRSFKVACGYPRLAGSLATNAGGLQVATLCSPRACLWRTGYGPGRHAQH